MKPLKCRVEFSNGIVIEQAYIEPVLRDMMIVYYSNDVEHMLLKSTLPPDTKIIIIN